MPGRGLRHVARRGVVVPALVDQVDPELGAEPAVDLVGVRNRELAARHVGLVRDDHQDVARLAQSADRAAAHRAATRNSASAPR